MSNHPDPDLGTDFEELPLTSHVQGLTLQLRTLINAATLLLVLSLLAVTAPWWLNATSSLWQQAFPPPPYTGSLLFVDNGLTLMARATTDGRVIWSAGSIQPNSAFFRDGPVLYIVPVGQQRLIALRVSDGRQLWAQPIAQADEVTFIGSYHNQIYLTTRVAGADAGNLLAFDQATGKPVSTIANVTTATMAASAHALAYCQGLGADQHISLINLDSEQQSWQHDLPELDCQMALTNNLVIAATFLSDQQLTHLTAFNQQDGSIAWQTDVAGTPILDTPTTIIDATQTADDASTIDIDGFTAIDITTGKQLWSHASQGVNAPIFMASIAADTGIITLNTTTTTMLMATDDRTGATRWTLPTMAQTAAPQSWQATLDTTTLYFADRSRLRAIDLATGKINWDVTGLAGVPTSLIRQGQNLYEIDGNQLHARDLQTGKSLWQQPLSLGTQICEQCDIATKG